MICDKLYHLGSNDKWKLCIITGARDTKRNYDINTEEGKHLRRNMSHLELRSFTQVKSSSSLARLLQPPQNSISGLLHSHKVKMILKHTGDTAYQPFNPRPIRSTEKQSQAEEDNVILRQPSNQCKVHSSKMTMTPSPSKRTRCYRF